MDVVLVHPEIPHNAGCAGRLTAAVGCTLHLVRPLGFSLEDRYLKRAGLDYWPLVDLVVHEDLGACFAHLDRGAARPLDERLKLFTARGGTSLFRAAFAPDDVLLFGSESRGLPAHLLLRRDLARVYVPVRPGVRSLNLANVVALSLYTAMNAAGLPLPDNDGRHEPLPEEERGVGPRHVARGGGVAEEDASGVDPGPDAGVDGGPDPGPVGQRP